MLGIKTEMGLAQLMRENKSLLKFGIQLDVRCARVHVNEYLQRNNDNCERLGFFSWVFIEITYHQSRGLRPRSYDKTGLRPASVLVLVLYFCSWSWSCSFGLGLNILVLLPTWSARCSAKRWMNKVS